MPDVVGVENLENYLFIKVKGVRDNFKQISEGSSLIVELANKYQKYNILTDYREVVFNVSMGDAFNLVRLYENKLTEFHKIKLATVTSKEQSELVRFYETIAAKRGFNIKVFYDIEKAKIWLESTNLTAS